MASPSWPARAAPTRGGWVRTLNVDGSVADPVEDAYDHSCVLLALAQAHRVGHPGALRWRARPSRFLDAHLEDVRLTGFLETPDGQELRRSNPHMHLLEAFLAWHTVTGDRDYLRRAARIIDLFRSHFFDAESWTLGEYFDDEWKPAPNGRGEWTEPGHHFEWASLLVDFAEKSGQKDLVVFARKLYASAIANGLNRATGLAYAAVSRQGLPLDLASRSWPQAEAIKAAIALDGPTAPTSSRRSRRASAGCSAGTSTRRRSACGSTRSTSAAGRRRPKCRPASSITWSRR